MSTRAHPAQYGQLISFPNNWSTQAGAEADAPSRGKTAADVEQIGAHPFYKICNDDCQMMKAGLTPVHFDDPCIHRVWYEMLRNAGVIP